MEPKFSNRIRINNQIRVTQVRVVVEDGTTKGVMSTRDALQMAKDANLDLVEINPKAIPPVCKILDYGKFKYSEKKKVAAAKKMQKANELKELTFRPNTDTHDLEHKLACAKEFLADGNRVKFSIRFRGREITHPQIGREKLEWLLLQLAPNLSNTPSISMEGKIMSMIVTPK